MELSNFHWTGITIAGIILISSLFFMNSKVFFFMLGIGFLIGFFPFVFNIIQKARIRNEKEQMFLEFARNLVESVKTGTPISKSIVTIKNKSYGVLSENVEKLANQISLGIPLNVALKVFSDEVNNKTISRAVTLIGQSERAGGDIGEILESVAEAVSTSDRLKKERRAAISTLVAQGYIIFFVFMIIIIIMQFKILPMVSGITAEGGEGMLGFSMGSGESVSQQELSSAFLNLLLVQGFFSGLIIGKLSEGYVKAGIKHSFALMFSSFLVSAGANIVFG